MHGLVDGTFIAVGLLQWFGIVGIRRALPTGRASWLATILLVLAGWGLAYAGVFPENVAPNQHRFGALLGLTCLNLGLITLGVVLLPLARELGVLAGLSGLIGLLGLALFLGPVKLLPVGTAERIADYPGVIMIIAIGAFLLVRSLTTRSPVVPTSGP